ncbi:MAG: YfhO family protein [Fibrobacter sp.]|nr:YfhO family protein [Fibrobacter sp.]
MQNKAEEKKADAPRASQKLSQPADSVAVVKKSLWSKSWVYFVIMGLLTAVVFSEFIFSNGMLFSSDQIGGFDTRVYLKNALVKFGEFPFWLNCRLGGMPTNDASFGDCFYPLSIVVTYLFPIAKGISIKMILHVFLAGVLFFLMLRKGFKVSPFISLIGAIFYMLNPEFFSHIYPGHDGKMYVIALLPFVIWRLKELLDKPNVLNVTLLSAGIGLSLLTSHVQMTYFVLWGIFFYWLVNIINVLIKKDTKKLIPLTVSFWAAVFLGIGIALIQFLPSYLYVQNAYSVRGVERGFEFASSWSLHWPEFFSMWVPEFGNTLDYYWSQNPFKLNSEYAGAMALLLSVLAIISKPTMWRIFWGSVAVFSILFSLGAHTPVFYLVYYIIPGVKKFRACSMIMFWFSFSTILLSSLFLKDVVTGKLIQFSDTVKKKWSKGLFVGVGLCLLLTLLFSMQGFVQSLFGSSIPDANKQNIFKVNYSKNFLPFLWLWFFFAATVLISLYYTINGKLKPVTFAILVLVIGIVDLLRVDMQFVKLYNPAPYFVTEPAIAELKKEFEKEPFRCFSLPGSLPQNGEGIHGLEGVSGFHDNELRWYREFRGEQDRNYLAGIVNFDEKGQAFLSFEKLSAGSPFLDIANVKNMLVRNGNELVAVKNVNALDRISFASKYVVIDTLKMLDAIASGKYDYRTTVALEKEPSVISENQESSLGTLVTKWEKYTPNYRKVTVKVPQDGFLRISEVYYPGWDIKVDGKHTEIYKADLAWMAVGITKGEHTVEMIPHSRNFKSIAAVSFVIIGILIIYWTVLIVLRRKK